MQQVINIWSGTNLRTKYCYWTQLPLEVIHHLCSVYSIDIESVWMWDASSTLKMGMRVQSLYIMEENQNTIEDSLELFGYKYSYIEHDRCPMNWFKENEKIKILKFHGGTFLDWWNKESIFGNNN